MADEKLSDRELLVKISAGVTDTNEEVKSLKSMYSIMSRDIDEMKKDQRKFASEHDDLCTTVGLLKKRLLSMERESRNKNLLIFKLQDEEKFNKNLYLSISEIFKAIKVEIPEHAIESIYRFGKSSGTRPVMVRFTSPRWKSLLFRSAKDLRELGLAISNDLTEDERRERKLLLQFQSRLREQGQETKLRGSYLIIENRPYSVKDLQRESETITAAEKEDMEVGGDESDLEEVATGITATPRKKRRLKQQEKEVKRGRSVGSKAIKDMKPVTQFFRTDKIRDSLAVVPGKE